MLPDEPFEGIDPKRFRDAIMQYGAVLLRRAVPEPVLSPVAAAVAEMMAQYDKIPRSVIAREIGYLPPYKRQEWREILDDGVHYNMDLIAFTAGQHSLFDPLRKSGLRSLVERAWPERTIRENHITNVRRVFSQQEDGYSDAPLSPHVDAQFHQHDLLGINFWTPLTDAGFDEPGLAIVPMSVDECRAYLEYNERGYDREAGDFASMHHFKTKKLENPELQPKFVQPQMRAGDVLAFTNFTIHATSKLPHMTKPRTSIEMRVLLLDEKQGELPADEFAGPTIERREEEAIAYSKRLQARELELDNRARALYDREQIAAGIEHGFHQGGYGFNLKGPLYRKYCTVRDWGFQHSPEWIIRTKRRLFGISGG